MIKQDGLTREAILAMPAGREMDALVARAIGHPPRDIPMLYSTDIAAAWHVVEKMAFEYEWEISQVVHYLQPGVKVWHIGPYPATIGDTAPLAVCRAALLATLEKP